MRKGRFIVSLILVDIIGTLSACGVAQVGQSEVTTEEVVANTEEAFNEDTFASVAPVSGAQLIGQKVSFETVDFDGNIVSSDEIFSQHEFTMVNVWATWCFYCLQELPELEAIDKEFAENDCGLVGLCGDAGNEEILKYAKDLVADNGVTYLNILPFDGWNKIFRVDVGWPTSYFVNRNGEIIGEPVIGAKPESYRKNMEELIENQSSKDKAEDGVSKNAYNIYVVDEDSNPLEGVKVQFCTDEICKLGDTDASGLASFAEPEGIYEVHILTVPDGYKQKEEVYNTEDKYGDMTITIEKE